MKPELSASKFALLFCITLRTYFKWQSDSDLDDYLLSYENTYSFACDPKQVIDGQKLEEKLLSMWETVHRKLKNKFYSNLEEAIRELGKNDDCGNMADYLFVPLWCPRDLLLTPETQIGTFRESGQILIKINRRCVISLCESSRDHNKLTSDICFKRFCYPWIVK